MVMVVFILIGGKHVKCSTNGIPLMHLVLINPHAKRHVLEVRSVRSPVSLSYNPSFKTYFFNRTAFFYRSERAIMYCSYYY